MTIDKNKSEHAVLSLEEWSRAHAAVRKWRADSSGNIACPKCGASALQIEDQSARPYAEWFYLTCASCGMEAVLQQPLAPPFVSAI